ncbi:hypothetical protein OROMI_023871 [Orobanche minor]
MNNFSIKRDHPRLSIIVIAKPTLHILSHTSAQPKTSSFQSLPLKFQFLLHSNLHFINQEFINLAASGLNFRVGTETIVYRSPGPVVGDKDSAVELEFSASVCYHGADLFLGSWVRRTPGDGFGLRHLMAGARLSRLPRAIAPQVDEDRTVSPRECLLLGIRAFCRLLAI